MEIDFSSFQVLIRDKIAQIMFKWNETFSVSAEIDTPDINVFYGFQMKSSNIKQPAAVKSKNAVCAISTIQILPLIVQLKVNPLPW